jgi:hypothetical protein
MDYVEGTDAGQLVAPAPWLKRLPGDSWHNALPED